MRSSDRTYRQSLIATDNDRKTKEHDLICQYLMIKSRRMSLLEYLEGRYKSLREFMEESNIPNIDQDPYLDKENTGCNYTEYPRDGYPTKYKRSVRWPCGHPDFDDVWAKLSVPVTKRWESYRSGMGAATVGFLDVVFSYFNVLQLVVEVKAKERSIPDLIQQLHMYQTLIPKSKKTRYCLCAPFSLSATEREILDEEDIMFIYVDMEMVKKELSSVGGFQPRF